MHLCTRNVSLFVSFTGHNGRKRHSKVLALQCTCYRGGAFIHTVSVELAATDSSNKVEMRVATSDVRLVKLASMDSLDIIPRGWMHRKRKTEFEYNPRT